MLPMAAHSRRMDGATGFYLWSFSFAWQSGTHDVRVANEVMQMTVLGQVHWPLILHTEVS